MAKHPKSLGDLKEMIGKYRGVLQRARNVKALDKQGNQHDVERARIDKAIASLQEAEEDLGEICQEAVLAIVVEE